jgi:hypothetical protein
MPYVPRALHASTVHTHSDGLFPYCRCVDYADISSPYSVILTNEDTPGNYSTSLTFVERPTPPAPSPCYERILTGGVPKIELMSCE